MIPYYEIPPLALGPVKIHAFGVLVATAVLTGSWLANKRSRELSLDESITEQLAGWAVVPGFIVAHLYSAIAYFPERIVENPLYLFKIWDGISSFGGFLGGAVGVMYFLSRKVPKNRWAYADAIIYGFALAWIFGRMGCTLAFDHPGALTTFPLAMPFPGDQELSAGVRHNLGFYEVFWAAAVSLLFYSQRKKAHFAGWYVVTFGLLYMPFRFALDFLRANDKRYFSFTPGQFGAIALFAIAIWVYLQRCKTEPVIPTEDRGPGARAPAHKAKKAKR